MRGCTLAPGIISISPLAQLGNESKFNSAVAKIAHYSRRVLFFRCRIEFPQTHLTDDTHRNAKPRVAPDAPASAQQRAAAAARLANCAGFSSLPQCCLSLEPARLRNSCVEGFLASEKSGCQPRRLARCNMLPQWLKNKRLVMFTLFTGTNVKLNELLSD